MEKPQKRHCGVTIPSASRGFVVRLSRFQGRYECRRWKTPRRSCRTFRAGQVNGISVELGRVKPKKLLVKQLKVDS